MARTSFNIMTFAQQRQLCGLLTRLQQAEKAFGESWQNTHKCLGKSQELLGQALAELQGIKSSGKPLTVRACEAFFEAEIGEKTAYGDYGKALLSGLESLENLQKELDEFIKSKTGSPLNEQAIARTENTRLSLAFHGAVGDAIFPYVKRFADDRRLYRAGEDRKAFIEMIDANTRETKASQEAIVQRMKADGVPDSPEMQEHMRHYVQSREKLLDAHTLCETKLLDAERRANEVMGEHRPLLLGPVELMKHMGKQRVF